MSAKLRQCRHYGNGNNGMLCGKGYSLKHYSFHTAPCFPRNRETPCEGRDWITQEEIDASEAECANFVERLVAVRALIVQTGKDSGAVQCPYCGKAINFSIASNGHVRATCETSGCVSWME
jgi:hypothetical protein